MQRAAAHRLEWRHALATLVGALLLPAAAASQLIEPWRVTVDVSPLTDVSGFSSHPTVEEHVTLVLSSDEIDCEALSFGPARVIGDRILVEASPHPTNVGLCTMGRGARQYQEVRLEPLREPGVYTIEVRLDGETLLAQPLEVWSPARGLLFTGGDITSRYYLEIHAFLTDSRVAPGGAREAASVRLTRHTGYFWFFESENVELTVKVLDGRAVNGRLWLFVTGMTDLGLTVEARSWGQCSGVPCPVHRYVNPPGGRLVVVDGIQPGK